MTPSRPTALAAAALLALSLGVTTSGCTATKLANAAKATSANSSPSHQAAAAPLADLRADTNRDGRVDLLGASDEAVEESVAAIFLPNLDDDTGRCAALRASAVVVNSCSDATDQVVNGDADALDLAPLQTMAMAALPDTATGTVSLSAVLQTRLFLQTPTGWVPVTPKTTLKAAQLRDGVHLGLEGRDILRDPKKWDGTATVQFTVTDGAESSSDEVSLKVAPITTTNHTMPLEQVLVSAPDQAYKESPAFNAALDKAAQAAQVPGGLRQLPKPFITYLQDAMEQVYVAMPSAQAPEGQQAMSLLMMSPSAKLGSDPLPTLRGPDLGLLWLSPNGGTKASGGNVSYEIGASGGNIETLPPYALDGTSYPFGRVLIGTDAKRESNSAVKRLIALLADQGQQPPLELDVSYLSVGHVDEIVQVLPIENERGWTLAIAAPRAGIQLLRRAQLDGAGQQNVVDLPGKYGATLDEALDPQSSKSVLKANEFAAKAIDGNIERLKAATGITDAELVRIPVFYREIPFEPAYHVSAEFPAAINSLVTSNTSVLVPSQGSVTVDGKDVFEAAIAKAYAAARYTVTWIDDTHLHQGSGDVHCGTNAIRQVPPRPTEVGETQGAMSYVG